MRILNLGSINIDHVYAVERFVRPGETLGTLRYDVFAGGKGFNQSIALARAGTVTRHAGSVGADGEWLLRRLQEEGVDTTHVKVSNGPTGHAVIQVIPSGENAIVLHGGANRAVSAADVARALSSCSPGEYLLVQNEISSVAEAIRGASERRLRVAFNPAPMTAAVRTYPLECVDLFVLNETEAEGLTGKSHPDDVRRAMRERYPRSAAVLTLGSRGAVYFHAGTLHRESAPAVKAVDTTAAGDTFIGFFLAELMRSGNPALALRQGCQAAAICVTRPGAADSIPRRDELKAIQSGAANGRGGAGP